jgi:adenosylhomocysteine/aminodeoxyfutalosine nucleosidase
MIAIISALKGEISPLFNHFPITKKLRMGKGTLYETSAFHLVRLGMGPKNSKNTLNIYLSENKPDLILNIGMVGRLNPALMIGSIHFINRIYYSKESESISLTVPSIITPQSSASLLTVDQPLTDPLIRNKFFKEFQAGLVDMEAYGLAQTAAIADIPFCSIKIVSDSADENTKNDFIKDYEKLSEKLGEYVIKFLDYFLKADMRDYTIK